MDLKHRHIHLLIGYWHGLRAASALPHEGELDADILRCLLPNIILLDRGLTGGIHVRLAGRQARQRFGADEKSWDFLASFAESDRPQVDAALTYAIKQGRPLRLFILALMRSGSWTEYEAVFLPVQGRDGTLSHFIGAHLPLGVADETDAIEEQYLLEMSKMELEARAPHRRSNRAALKVGLRLVSSRG